MRVFRSAFYALAGLALIIAGWLMPAHFRAVDASVIERVSPGSISLIEAGIDLLRVEKTGPAEMLLLAAQRADVPGRDRLNTAIQEFKKTLSEAVPWGGADPYLEQIFPADSPQRPSARKPIIELFLPLPVRAELFDYLRFSRRPAVHAVLQNRQLRNTEYFRPVYSASGQPLDATILLTALLMQGDYLTPTLRDEVESAALTANRGGSITGIEGIYIDIVALARRLDWSQLTTLLRPLETGDALRDLANLIRSSDEHLPVIFAAAHLSREPGKVGDYLVQYSRTGLDDLSFALRGGSEGVKHLLTRGERIYYPRFRVALMESPLHGAIGWMADTARTSPRTALALKILVLLFGTFLVGHALLLLLPGPSPLERPLEVPGFRTAREWLFSISAVLFLLVASEPFLAQESQVLQIRIRLPEAAEALRASLITKLTPIMDQLTILALLIFLVLQGIIYVVCLLKLAEIRRQPVPSQTKLKLLDNEENLFDAGLYCGLGGTVGSLVFLALGIIKASLMAAYASTLFGIIFVAILKIFHLRPLRRRLILEVERHHA